MSAINTNYTSSMWDKYMPKKLNEQEAKAMGERIANNPANYDALLASAPKNRSFKDVIRGDKILGVYAGSMASLTGQRLYLGKDQAVYEAWRASENKNSNLGNPFAHYQNSEIWNAKGLSNTIETPYGEMRVSLKLDGFYYDIENLSELSYLDTYKDGFISGNDYLADKLVLRGYDANGDEVEFNFLQVMGGFDLTELYNDKKYELNWNQQEISSTIARNVSLSSHSNSLYRAEVSYKKHDSKNTIALFEAYADKNGWIDFKNDVVAQKFFANQNLQLAYRKVGADGNSRLEKISIGTNYNEALDAFNSRLSRDNGFNANLIPYLLNHHVDSGFNRKAIFSAMLDKDSSYFNDVRFAKAFTDFTGLAYTESNIQKVKDGLESGGEEFLNSLADIESVTGMKLDKDNGTITLRFSSGRETTIALEDLYSDSGEFLVDTNGQRAMPMNEAKEMTQEELNELDFEKVGAIFDDSGRVASLKEWGITAIQKATYADGRFLSFVLTNAEGMKFNVKELYNLSFLSGGWLEGKHENQTDSQSESALQKVAPKPIVSPNKPIDMRV